MNGNLSQVAANMQAMEVHVGFIRRRVLVVHVRAALVNELVLEVYTQVISRLPWAD